MEIDYQYITRRLKNGNEVSYEANVILPNGRIELLSTFRRIPRLNNEFGLVEERGKERFYFGTFKDSILTEEVVGELAKTFCVNDFQTRLKTMRYKK